MENKTILNGENTILYNICVMHTLLKPLFLFYFIIYFFLTEELPTNISVSLFQFCTYLRVSTAAWEMVF